MPSIAILGGSVIGSAAALLFARAGWAVTLVDPELPLMARPDDDLPRRRPGAPQAVQAHAHTARATYELRTRLPDVYDALLAAGANVLPFAMPPHLATGGPNPTDDRLTAIRTRRVVLDAVIADAVRQEPGVTALTVKASSLVLEDRTVPRATGLRLADGRTVPADVLLDAGGRRSPVTGWLARAGIDQPEETSECALTYYSRHHRIVAEPPPMPGFAVVLDFPTHQLLGFRGDRDYLTVALVRHAGDKERARWQDDEEFDSALTSMPGFVEWRRALEPAGPVLPMGAVRNRMTALVDQDRPLVLGLHQVGDALTTTNPSRGRGIAFGLTAVGRLHDLLTAGDTLPPADDVALELHAWQRDVLRHYYRETCVVDLELAARIRATLTGGEAPPTAPAVLLPERHPVTSEQVAEAAGRDAELFRLFVRALHMMDDEREIASPTTTAWVRRLLADPQPG
jgi:2-polyprenyl-6-methoxyphenol hydroxylase-like FAD-dependent oxidoreductase